MSLTFREAKSQLEANNVGELRTILEQAQRPTSEPISSEDFDFLKVVHPLIKQGMSIQQALNLYSEVPNTSSINQMPNTLRQEFIISSVEDALQQDIRNFYLLYFGLWQEAMGSPQITNDPEVQQACRKAVISTFGVAKAVSADPNFLNNFKQRLRQKGLISNAKEPVMLEAGIDIQEAA